MKSLQTLRYDLRDILVNKYLENCRTEHNVVFFKWREEISIDAKSLVDKYSMKLLRNIEKEQASVDNEGNRVLIKLSIEFKNAFLSFLNQDLTKSKQGASKGSQNNRKGNMTSKKSTKSIFQKPVTTPKDSPTKNGGKPQNKFFKNVLKTVEEFKAVRKHLLLNYLLFS